MDTPDLAHVRNNRRGMFYAAVSGATLFVASLACLSSSTPPVSDGPLGTLTDAASEVSTQSDALNQPEQSSESDNDFGGLLSQISSDNLMRHVENLAAIHSRHVNSQTIDDAALLIRDGFLAAGGGWQVQFDEFPLAFGGLQTTQRNVVATLAGDPSAGVVLVGAHYDSRSTDIGDSLSRAPGANDNATGVAALLEMARVLGALGTPPRATVIFVAFSAEEMGTHGSLHYVQSAAQRGQDVRAMLVLDIIGNSAGESGEDAIRVFSAPPTASSSRHLARFMDFVGQTYLPTFDVRLQETIDRPGRYSDHVPFNDAGVPAVRLIETIEDTARQHSEFDLPGQISPQYLLRATQLSLATVVNLAYGPARPAAPHRLPGQSNTISWSQADGAAGYLLAFRREDSSQISRIVRIATPDSVSLTIPELAQKGFSSVGLAVVDGAGLTSMFSSELGL